jgi:hypothetical protein
MCHHDDAVTGTTHFSDLNIVEDLNRMDHEEMVPSTVLTGCATSTTWRTDQHIRSSHLFCAYHCDASYIAFAPSRGCNPGMEEGSVREAAQTNLWLIGVCWAQARETETWTTQISLPDCMTSSTCSRDMPDFPYIYRDNTCMFSTQYGPAQRQSLRQGLCLQGF